MGVQEAVVLEIPADDDGSTPARVRVPPRITRRLLRVAGDGGGGKASTAQEIEARLREADLRRQKFHETMSSKARHTFRIAQSQEEVPPGKHLEAKLAAAEQKRLSLLAKERIRLAKLDELRHAAKNDAEMRFKSEREELGLRVVSRLQHAEEKRKQLLHARLQRRAALEERTKRFFVQKLTGENKYREHVQSAILQKRTGTVAEKKQLRLIEHKERQTHSKLLQVHLAANISSSQKETETSMLKEQLEDKLQRAKWQRAEYLKQRGSPPSSMCNNTIENGEFLSRKLARCWRRFITSRKTTVVLSKAFDALGINQHSIMSMPFEELACCIKSPAVLHTTKALLDRLESRFVLSQSLSSSKPERIKLTPKKAAGSSYTSKMPRYSLKVVLCAYMILGHPKFVLNEQGEQGEELVKSAASFVKEFETLVRTILDGPDGACILSHSMLDFGSPESSNYLESSSIVGHKKKFRSQLVAFDKAWCAYHYQFVMWKRKNAKSLEEDLIKTACKMELSMMQTCKITTKGQANNIDGDFNGTQKQVIEDQKLVRGMIRNMSGEAGIRRMESALSETRNFIVAKELRRSMKTMVANTASPTVTSSPGDSNLSDNMDNSNMDAEKTSRVIKSLCSVSSSSSESDKGVKVVSATLSTAVTEKMPTANEQMVNDILHDTHSSLTDKYDNVGSIEGDLKAKIKDTMEKAYWDVVADSLRGDMPDYSHLVNLVKEVRETLHELAAIGWKDEISNNINLEVLSQVLDSGSQDRQYLGQILRYSLGMLRKLSSPAKEEEMKKNHDKLLRELIEDPESKYRDPNSFVISVIKGLRFTMGELKALKAEVGRAHIRLGELIIKSSGGIDYLQKAFAVRYGSPSDALASIPSTAQWFSSLKDIVEEEWNEHISSVSVLTATNHVQPLVATLRTGRGVPNQTQSLRPPADIVGLPECTGEGFGMVLRIGLLHLISDMEGMTGRSVPETFKLNWLRLRSVQSKFQQMIVIATSMLVLQQVLLSENPKVAPSELENATMDLFNTLTKLLDNFSDAGTEHIIDVMMRSSTATCASSDEMTEARKQILTRVFLKSLQTDDTVFKKVSRSVYCAFRAVTLGGSGAKGRMLADAALRRIGAIKLTDRVVKAAEVLIKATMISEQVHGPWYKQLL